MPCLFIHMCRSVVLTTKKAHACTKTPAPPPSPPPLYRLPGQQERNLPRGMLRIKQRRGEERRGEEQEEEEEKEKERRRMKERRDLENQIYQNYSNRAAKGRMEEMGERGGSRDFIAHTHANICT